MILRLIIAIIAVYIIVKLIGKGFKKRDEVISPKNKTPVGGEDLVEDPYCHAYIPIGQAIRAEIGGKTVYFCSQKCFEKYKEENQ